MSGRYVIDATMGGPPFCFCPVEGDLDADFTVVTGMNFVGTPPERGTVVAVVHSEGQDAVNAFYAEHGDDIRRFLTPEKGD